MTPKQTATILFDMSKPKRDMGNAQEELRRILTEMAELLDEGDQDDQWGTEGWRHRVGLED